MLHVAASEESCGSLVACLARSGSPIVGSSLTKGTALCPYPLLSTGSMEA